MFRSVQIVTYLLLSGCILDSTAFAQRITNLSHEQFGDKIIIKYDIVGATSNQSFLVKATCNSSGKSIPVLHAENSNAWKVKGGDNRQIVWNVLQDVNELVDDNVTFTVFATPFEDKQLDNSDNVTASRGMSIANKKSLLYADLTAQTETYLEEVYNMVTQFRSFGDRAFESQADLKRLDMQTTKTNSAYDKLIGNRRMFEQSVRDLWGSELLNCQTETFFRRSLDQMHRTFLLPLNETVRKINELSLKYTSKGDRSKTIERLKLEIEIRTSQLDQEINSIKGDAKGFYADLKQ